MSNRKSRSTISLPMERCLCCARQFVTVRGRGVFCTPDCRTIWLNSDGPTLSPTILALRLDTADAEEAGAKESGPSIEPERREVPERAV